MPTVPNAGEDVARQGFLGLTVGDTKKLLGIQQLWKTILAELNTVLSSEQAIFLRGIYPSK